MVQQPLRNNVPIRVLIADDHEISRIGIRRLLSVSPDIEIVAEAVNGLQTLDLARSLKPDVVLMDVNMPTMSGIDAASRSKSELPNIKVIMLSAANEQETVERALYAGADGFLTKEVGSVELCGAIVNVMQGERVFSKSIIALLEGGEAPRSEEQPHFSLTKREEQIVALVAAGLTSQEIGKKLFISHRTVETHRARIMDKLGVSNTAGLVRFALLHARYFNLQTNDR
jgi:DNA-binding NarL/FixJ family response regulator